MLHVGKVLFVLFLFCIPCAYAGDKLPFKLPRSYQELPPTALVETDEGSFEIEFLRTTAPIAVKNFEYLARKGFYNNLTFHHYEPGYVVYSGDPTATGKGGPGYSLPPEFSEYHFKKGTLGMARLPSEVNPERRANGSQFFILLQDAPHLEGNYTAFAQVSAGLDTVEKLRKGSRIIRIRFPKQ